MAEAEFDAVVVGSGAGGAAAAWALAGRGARVLLLEAGPEYDPFSDYPLERDDWEVRQFPHKIPPGGRQTFAPMQRLAPAWDRLRSWNRLRGRLVRGDRRVSHGYHHVVGLGGSTLQFTGEAHRMHPRAMRMRTEFGVAADWPVTYDMLEPFYQEAERLVGVAGPADDATRPRSAPFPLPPHAPSHASRVLTAGFAALGMGVVANALAALSAPHDGRPECNYCGGCLRGCPRIDKGTADVTFIRHARGSGRCTIRTGATVTRLLTGPRDRIEGVVYADAAGAEHRVRARATVLACGAVETPRLLLLNAGPRAPDGLANESGEVGRNFMDTLVWTSSALHPDRIGSHRGLPVDIVSWRYNAPDAIPGVVGGCRFAPAMAESDLVGPMNYALRVVPGFGRRHKQAMRDAFGRVLSVAAIGESLPNARSFIDLDPAEKDTRGLPKARIHAWLEDDALQRLDFMAKTCRAVLKAAGAENPFEELSSFDTFGATHVFGTCRMGADPRESVVDGDLRSHRWRNLVIADASVFPSSGGGESPALTIHALAIRAGRGLADSLARGDL